MGKACRSKICWTTAIRRMSDTTIPRFRTLLGRPLNLPSLKVVVVTCAVVVAVATVSLELALILGACSSVGLVWMTFSFSTSYIAIPCLFSLGLVGLFVGLDLKDAAELAALVAFFGLVTVTTTELARPSSRRPMPAAASGSWSSAGEWFKAHGDYLICFGVALVAAQSWFETGKLLGFGDFYPLSYSNSDVVLEKASHLWNTLSSGTGSRNFTVVQLPNVLISHVLQNVGLSGDLSQRIILSLLFAGQAVAMVFLLRQIWPRSSAIARAAGALFYLFNPLGFYMIPGPAQMLGLALMPLLAGLMIRSLRRGGRTGVVMWSLCTLALSYVAANPPLALVVVISAVSIAAIVHLAEGGSILAIGRFFIRTIPLSLVLNLWWIVPALLTLTTTAVSEIPASPADWGWTQIRNSIPNVLTLNTGWGWTERIYYPYAGAYDHVVVATAMYLPVVVAFAALTFKKYKANLVVPFFALSVLVLVFLSKGIHSPFEDVNVWLFEHIPGLSLLREPALKLLPAVSVLLAALITASVQAAREVVSDRTARKGKRVKFPRRLVAVMSAAFVMAAGLALPTAAMPLATGDVVADERPILPGTHVELPDHWHNLAEYLNSLPDQREAVLLLPLSDYYQVPYDWGYYGTDGWASELIRRSVIFGQELTYISSGAARERAQTLERAVLRGEFQQVAWSAQALGVRYIVVRRDLDRRVLRKLGRRTPEIEEMEGFLLANPMIKLARRFGPLSLFEVNRPQPEMISAHSEAGWWVSGHGAPTDGILAVGLLPVVLERPGGGVPQGSDLSVFAESHSALVSARRRDLVAVKIPLHSDLKKIKGTPVLTRLASKRRLPSDEPLYVQFDSGLSERVSPNERDVVSVLARWDKAETLKIKAPREHVLFDGSFERPEASRWSPVRDCAPTAKSNDTFLAASRVRDSFRDEQTLRIESKGRLACVIQPLNLRPSGAYELSFAYKRGAGQDPRVCLFAQGAGISARCLNTPLPKGGTGWQDTTEAIKVPRKTTSTRLFLYADSDRRRTVSFYDDISIRKLSLARSYRLVWEEGVKSINWDEIESVLDTVRTSSSTPQANLVENSSFRESVKRPVGWSRIGDCNRVEEASLKELGISASIDPVGADGDGSLRLTAERNMGCVSQRVGVHAGELYSLSLVHRSSGPAGASLCILVPSRNECLDIRHIRRSREWTTFETRFSVPSTDKYIDLYLYAPGTGNGKTINLYDNVEVRALDFRPEPFVVVKPMNNSGSPQLGSNIIGTNRYQISIRNAEDPFILTLNQSFDSGWTLQTAEGDLVNAPHLKANGFANAWILDKPGSYTLFLEFKPERWAIWATYVSVASAMIAIAWCAWRRIRSAMRERSPLLPRPQE
jgi:arabinofuranan 3-O-arabinosyltransferase